MKVIFSLLLLITVILLLFVNGLPTVHVNETAVVNGFWNGLGHGVCFVASFVVSLFNHKVCLYSAYNTGVGYNVGFFMGVCLWYRVIFK